MKDFEQLFVELEQKVNRADPNSDTVKRLSQGIHQVGKKVVEEAAEVWMAAEYEDQARTAEEISQLIYHLQVIMLAKGLQPADIWRHL